MLTIQSKYAAENIILNSEEEKRIMVEPNFITKISFLLEELVKVLNYLVLAQWR